jgi:hypothetical protein
MHVGLVVGVKTEPQKLMRKNVLGTTVSNKLFSAASTWKVQRNLFVFSMYM